MSVFFILSVGSMSRYCDRAKALFDTLKQPYHAIELDQMNDGADIQALLKDFTGQRTVPNIFINGKHIGGCDDLMSLHKSAKLESLLVDK